MTRFLMFAILALTVSASNAAVMTSVESAPTTDLPGFITHTLTITPETDAASLSLEVVGPVNQVNPFTLATIFTDNNPTFAGAMALPEQDTQFLFNSSDVIVADSSESDSGISAGFAFNNNLLAGQPVAIAQIVLPDGESATFSGGTGLAGVTTPFSGTIGGGGGGGQIPEPTSVALIGLGIAGVVARRRRV